MNPGKIDRAALPDPEFFTQVSQNFGVLLAVSAVFLALTSGGTAVGTLLIGAVVSAANFWLLSRSIPKLLRADHPAPPIETGRIVRRALFEFVGRYVVVGGVAYLAVRNQSVNLMVFAMGLSLPLFAIMVQGIRMIFSVQHVKSA